MNKIFPENKNNLVQLVFNEINKNGYQCDLNHIDISNINDLSYLFSNSNFNGDISTWKVENVTDMEGLFYKSEFNGDISKWNTLNVKNMSLMFFQTPFNKDISNWNIKNLKYINNMFYNSKFNGDINNWDVRNIDETHLMNLKSDTQPFWDFFNFCYVNGFSKVERDLVVKLYQEKLFLRRNLEKKFDTKNIQNNISKI